MGPRRPAPTALPLRRHLPGPRQHDGPSTPGLRHPGRRQGLFLRGLLPGSVPVSRPCPPPPPQKRGHHPVPHLTLSLEGHPALGLRPEGPACDREEGRAVQQACTIPEPPRPPEPGLGQLSGATGVRAPGRPLEGLPAFGAGQNQCLP